MPTSYDQDYPKCTCLDSALQRQALVDGHPISKETIYPENREWLEKKGHDRLGGKFWYKPYRT